MKRLFGSYLLVCFTLVGFAGCASDDTTSNRPQTASTTGHHQKKSDDDDDNHDMDSPPHVGMTKAQVLKKYGEPKSRNVSDEGEVWGYRLNLGQVALEGLNPFRLGGPQMRFGTITFGRDGRVKKYQWQADTHDD